MSSTEEIVESEDEEEVYESEAVSEYVEKVLYLKIVLYRDLFACDAKWILFVSAALSYRYDSLLRPFPPKFMNEKGADIDQLMEAINEVPPLRMILNYIEEEKFDELDPDVMELLNWLLVTECDPNLRSVNQEEYDIIIDKTLDIEDMEKPTHIFEVVPKLYSKHEEKFEKQKEGHDTNLAFYGTKLTNFYSIIYNGLHRDMFKNGQFGEGIYLSTRLSVSMNDSPTGAAWGASLCGVHISCIAICEYVNNPDYTKTHVKNCGMFKEPQTYVVINKNEAVRVRYLMFFDLKAREEPSPRMLGMTWLGRNKYYLIGCWYALIFGSFYVLKSDYGTYIRDVITKGFSDTVNFFKNLFSDGY